MLFKAVSHFNDIIKGPRQEDESLFFVFPFIIANEPEREREREGQRERQFI